MANSFEENLKRLESIVDRLERGELGLEDSLQLFEQGIALSEQCKQELDAADGRVQVLLDRGNRRERAVEDLQLGEADRT